MRLGRRARGPEIDVRRLHLNPGDHLVVRLNGRAAPEHIAFLKDQLKPRFPDNEILVVDQGTDLLVVGAGSPCPPPSDPGKGTN